MVGGCWLLVAGWLFVFVRWLLLVGCWFAMCCMLLVMCASRVACCLLFVLMRVSFRVPCVVIVVCRLLFVGLQCVDGLLLFVVVCRVLFTVVVLWCSDCVLRAVRCLLIDGCWLLSFGLTVCWLLCVDCCYGRGARCYLFVAGCSCVALCCWWLVVCWLLDGMCYVVFIV